jgi:hypothetical protein
MCQLTHAYASSIRVPWTTTFAGANKLVDDSGWCDHLGAFIEAILGGEPVRALKHKAAYPERADEAACSALLINYANGDGESLHASDYQENPCYGLHGYERVERGPCSEIVDDCGAFKDTGTALLPWNDYTIVQEELGYASSTAAAGRSYTWWRSETASPSDGSPWPAPPESRSTACHLGERRLLYHPAHLAFDAELCDTLMFMAQLCLDYAKSLFRGEEPGWSDRALESVQAGQQFAQYALAPIAGRARILVHECGHAYLGGTPHCGYAIGNDGDGDGDHRWRSCFDVAGRFLWSQVTAENGLPIDTYVANGALSRNISSEPDFLHRSTQEGENERAVWVYEWVNPFLGCERVQRGAEERQANPKQIRDGTRTVCVGRHRVDLAAPGVSGGGFTFATTNGCMCSAPVTRSASAELGWSYSVPNSCRTTAVGARGVHSVPTT